MRLRNVPGAREVMIENEFVFTEPENMAGTWKEVFGNNNPVFQLLLKAHWNTFQFQYS